MPSAAADKLKRVDVVFRRFRAHVMTAAEAGEALLAARLLKTRGRPTNNALAGAAVLAVLVRLGFVRKEFIFSRGQNVYSLTEAGKEELRRRTGEHVH